jgi:hypothetical protein
VPLLERNPVSLDPALSKKAVVLVSICCCAVDKHKITLWKRHRLVTLC